MQKKVQKDKVYISSSEFKSVVHVIAQFNAAQFTSLQPTSTLQQTLPHSCDSTSSFAGQADSPQVGKRGCRWHDLPLFIHG